MIPEMFCECVLRVYVRNATEENMEWARKAFERYNSYHIVINCVQRINRLCCDLKLSKPGPVFSRPCTPKKSSTPLLSANLPASSRVLNFGTIGEKRPRDL